MIAVLLCLSIVFLMFSCGKLDEAIDSKENSNSHIQIVGSSYFYVDSPWADEYYDDQVLQEMDITFDGTTYHVFYDESMKMEYDYYPRHTYRDLSKDAKFCLDPDGNLVYALIHNMKGEPLESPLSVEQGMKLAEKFLSTLVKDPDQYTASDTSTLGDTSVYHYVKYVDSWKTADEIWIHVNQSMGKIYGFDGRMLDKIDTDMFVTFNQSAIEYILTEQINEMYAENQYIDWVECKFEHVLTMVGPTEYGVISEATIDCYSKDFDYIVNTEGLWFLISP